MFLFGENHLLSLCVGLGAEQIEGLSVAEAKLIKGVKGAGPDEVGQFKEEIRCGGDPLGETFCFLREAPVRRGLGATYTPRELIDVMLKWAQEQGSVARVVDGGAGSGRFLLEAGKKFPRATLLGVEIDPVAALMCRANLSVAGMATRSEVLLGDYREVELPEVSGRTLFVGNPPYVRHHLIEPRWKQWLARESARLGHEASQLAGLHVHFFLATLLKAKPGDLGVLVTAAEWLDVNYGKLVRSLLLNGLGGRSISVVEPEARVFADAATTAAVTCFEVGSKPSSIFLRRAAAARELEPLESGRPIRRERLAAESRWSIFTRVSRKPPEGFVELGELCRVHRGQVTGANDVWIAGEHSQGLPECVQFATVTRAKELFTAGEELSDASDLKRVIDLPVDLEVLERGSRLAVDRFLRFARSRGAHEGYVAKNRKAWWSVGLRLPAPVLCTYMARRPPAFVLNEAEARHINIAHGLYPRESMTKTVLRALARYLAKAVTQDKGRTYAGGLTKFEPRELERIFVPLPQMMVGGRND